jgi:hypothetical protein
MGRNLGELMMYERILKGDRQEVANPLGYQPDFVEGLMEVYEVYEDVGTVKADQEAHAKSSSDMRTTLGEARYAKLQLLAKEYRENLKDSSSKEGKRESILKSWRKCLKRMRSMCHSREPSIPELLAPHSE